jgi:uncharacterized membrane protein (DUF2068 family)
VSLVRILNIPHSFERTKGTEEFGAAIRLGEKAYAEREALRWGIVLVVFMRLLAALWMAQGLGQWVSVLISNAPLFDSMPPSVASAVIFFGVIDLVAAVGLWLATPWGGVLWLLATISQIFIAVAIQNFFSVEKLVIVSDFLLILIYFVLTWKAGHSSSQSRRLRSRN